MRKVAQFEKVSYEQFTKDMIETFGEMYSEEDIKHMYEKIKLPKRATKGSAGYDFYTPFSFALNSGKELKIPTGIRCIIHNGWFLSLFPRSGLGFKYRLQLNNTVGIVDGDYCYSDNEGHIFAKVTNDSKEDKIVDVKDGEAFMQGIFLEYGITVDDETNGVRNGGFGSTSK